MNEVSKSAALLNAQAIMASAVMFGHGDVVTLSVNEEAVALSVIYDNARFVYDREIEWFMNRCMCGVQHWVTDDKECHMFTIHVVWLFNPNLK